MMFKSLNGLAPLYLQDLFSERHTDYDFRHSFRIKVKLTQAAGALLWNSLPENIRAIRSIG
ncbi:unnamed protein product [Porites evermanni]|uniref:Uncharacterized protein n=1 Tax=Porites evermanni TaxID=104178 RepID=A0ABN8PJB3_9CNID|nr:unnamed protein product [Porites evermanni]